MVTSSDYLGGAVAACEIYVAAISGLKSERLSLTVRGEVCYQLKTPYSDGTTHVVHEPLDFIAGLVALIPKPRVNLTGLQPVSPIVFSSELLRTNSCI